MKYRTASEPCRVCGRDSFLFDETGPVHLCCARLPEGETDCPACRASDAAEYGWQSHGKAQAKARAKQAALIAAADDR